MAIRTRSNSLINIKVQEIDEVDELDDVEYKSTKVEPLFAPHNLTKNVSCVEMEARVKSVGANICVKRQIFLKLESVRSHVLGGSEFSLGNGCTTLTNSTM